MPDVAGFIAGVGTGGTLTGVGRSLKKYNPDVKVWAMEPAESPLITEGYFGSHNIQGIGANFIPQNLDLSLVDKTITVTSDDAIAMSKNLAEKQACWSGFLPVPMYVQL